MHSDIYNAIVLHKNSSAYCTAVITNCSMHYAPLRCVLMLDFWTKIGTRALNSWYRVQKIVTRFRESGYRNCENLLRFNILMPFHFFTISKLSYVCWHKRDIAQ